MSDLKPADHSLDYTGKSLKPLFHEIAAGQIAPCYLLHGEEEYLLQNTLQQILDLIIPQGNRDLSLFTMDGEQEDIDALCEALMTPSLLSGRKIIVLRNTRLFQSKITLPLLVQKIREYLEHDPYRAAKTFLHFLTITGWHLDDLRNSGWEKISNDQWRLAVEESSWQERVSWLPMVIDLCVSYGLETEHYREDTNRLSDLLLKGLPERNHLIISADTVDKRKTLFKTISQLGQVIYFPKVKQETKLKESLQYLARELLKQRGKTLSQAAWVALGRKTGFNLRDSLGAIEKLIDYTGEKPIIEETDIEEVIGKTKEDTVFDLTSALAGRNLAKSLSTLNELLSQNVHPLVIMTMLIREIRYLLHAKILIQSNLIDSFNPNMDYFQFQKIVYPSLKEQIPPSIKKEGALIAQHPFVIYSALKNTHHFSYDETLSHAKALIDMDIAFKTTAKDPKLTLEAFLIKVCTTSIELDRVLQRP
jgi:DNA polymerase-3 subunit delta